MEGGMLGRVGEQGAQPLLLMAGQLVGIPGETPRVRAESLAQLGRHPGLQGRRRDGSGGRSHGRTDPAVGAAAGRTNGSRTWAI